MLSGKSSLLRDLARRIASGYSDDHIIKTVLDFLGKESQIETLTRSLQREIDSGIQSGKKEIQISFWNLSNRCPALWADMKNIMNNMGKGIYNFGVLVPVFQTEEFNNFLKKVCAEHLKNAEVIEINTGAKVAEPDENTHNRMFIKFKLNG